MAPWTAVFRSERCESGQMTRTSRASGEETTSDAASTRDRCERARIPSEQIAEFCRRHHIRRLSLFGSILREDFRLDGARPSDVDVLVEFEPGHTPGWEIVTIEEELSDLFGGRRVDLVNPKYLNRRLRDRVLGSAELCYESPNDQG